jgi:hypothetical protein
MKNNKAKVSKPKKPAKSKVYNQKKPAKKLKLKKVEADTNSINNVNYNPPVYNEDTYTTQDNSNTTFISVSGDEPNTTYTTDSNSLYSKLDDPVETEVKRSEILPEYKEPSHTNLIIMLIGVAAFAALLLLLI